MEILLILIAMVVITTGVSLYRYRLLMLARTKRYFEAAFPNQPYAKYRYVIGAYGSKGAVTEYREAYQFVYKTVYWSGQVNISKINKIVYVSKLKELVARDKCLNDE